MKAYIFANGTMQDWPAGLAKPGPPDLIICADGGLRHCLGFGLAPQVVVGDMDSASPQDLAGLDSRVEIIRHPPRKDETDLELALMTAGQKGADEIIILGALGLRWDMSLANVLILASRLAPAGSVRIWESGQQMICLKGPQRFSLPGQPGDIVSLLPLSGQVLGVTLFNMDYPLDRATLDLGTTWGISNVIKQQPAEVEFDSGVLLVVATDKALA